MDRWLNDNLTQTQLGENFGKSCHVETSTDDAFGKLFNLITSATLQLFKWVLSHCCSYVDPDNILHID